MNDIYDHLTLYEIADIFTRRYDTLRRKEYSLLLQHIREGLPRIGLEELDKIFREIEFAWAYQVEDQ